MTLLWPSANHCLFLPVAGDNLMGVCRIAFQVCRDTIEEIGSEAAFFKSKWVLFGF